MVEAQKGWTLAAIVVGIIIVMYSVGAIFYCADVLGDYALYTPVIDFYHPSKNDRFTKFIASATDYAFQMPSVKVAEAQRHYTDDV